MSTGQSGADNSGRPDHSGRNAVVADLLSVAIGLTVAHTDPAMIARTPELPTDTGRGTAQVESVPRNRPETAAVPSDMEEAGEGEQLKYRSRRDRAFDLLALARDPEQVEDRRRDARPER